MGNLAFWEREARVRKKHFRQKYNQTNKQCYKELSEYWEHVRRHIRRYLKKYVELSEDLIELDDNYDELSLAFKLAIKAWISALELKEHVCTSGANIDDADDSWWLAGLLWWEVYRDYEVSPWNIDETEKAAKSETEKAKSKTPASIDLGNLKPMQIEEPGETIEELLFPQPEPGSDDIPPIPDDYVFRSIKHELATSKAGKKN